MDAAIGVGTGSIPEHYTALSDSGGRLYASAMSSKARAIDRRHHRRGLALWADRAQLISFGG
jgi:hypothetical protein